MNVNQNIPQGRGMIKWAPFATMPEQYVNVHNIIEAQLHVPKPNLTDDLQQELELKLRECISKNVILRYWSDSYELQDECIIEDMDERSRIVTVRKNDVIMFIRFEYIFEVIGYEYMI